MIQQMLAALKMVGQQGGAPIAAPDTPFSSEPANVWDKYTREHERQSAYENVFEDSHSVWAQCMTDGERLAELKCRSGLLPGNRPVGSMDWTQCLDYWADGAPAETSRVVDSRERSAQAGGKLSWGSGPLAVEVGGNTSTKASQAHESSTHRPQVAGYREACNALEEKTRADGLAKLPEWMRMFNE